MKCIQLSPRKWLREDTRGWKRRKLYSLSWFSYCTATWSLICRQEIQFVFTWMDKNMVSRLALIDSLLSVLRGAVRFCRTCCRELVPKGCTWIRETMPKQGIGTTMDCRVSMPCMSSLDLWGKVLFCPLGQAVDVASYLSAYLKATVFTNFHVAFKVDRNTVV